MAEKTRVAIHKLSIRLYNNAGISFPVCYAYPSNGLLDMDKSRLATTGDSQAVTCKRCQKLMAKGDIWG